MTTRRTFMRAGTMAGAGLLLPWKKLIRSAGADPIAGGTLPPGDVPKWVADLVKPPAMPISRVLRSRGQKIDYYEIAVRQFQQNILPPSMNLPTTVWSYGSLAAPGTVAQGGTFNYPAFTIEARHNRPVRVKWINELVDANGDYLPHILPVDQTLHWANPNGNRDTRGTNPAPYMGPVPMITHVHGAHTTQDFDGYPEAWYLPDAGNIPNAYWRTGTFYDQFEKLSFLGKQWRPGHAVFQYANDQRATTLWYHDHTLGMTRLNVYAGPAGYFLIRGGPDDRDLGYVAPGVGDDPFGEYTEIPIVIQDRSFNDDGSLFYPDNRAFFEGLNPEQLQIPFIPDAACDGPSDISPIWNPEFFGNMMVVNGGTWPKLQVERRRYRFRFLNGCNSRFLVLKLTKNTYRHSNDGFNTPDMPFYQIGAEGGFLPGTVQQDRVLMSPAERADVIVDFGKCTVGDEIFLVNDGPDAPFGGISTEDLSDWESTGLVMRFDVVADGNGDGTTPPMELGLPAAPPVNPNAPTRATSLNEEGSSTVNVREDEFGNIVLDCDNGEEFGPKAALLGTYAGGVAAPLLWNDAVTENPGLGATETWEIYNKTEDAHPIHIHQVQFQVVGREDIGGGNATGPEPGETGFKDTVIAYPGQVTRVQQKFDIPGLFVWHCHIVEHEDNEMMRPYRVG